ncbi:MAG: AAA family ATPase, partial [Burkholderiaceae bacterium]
MAVMTDESRVPDAAHRRIAELRAWLQVRDGLPVRLIETHISWVLLSDALAYKLKKPVRLPFLDYTTLARRRRSCEAELHVNARLAPTLYLDVIEVRSGSDGASLDEVGPVVDVALRMRRFPDGALWSEMVATDTLAPSDVDALARRLTGFHDAAAIAPTDSRFGTAAVHRRALRRLIAAIDAWPSLNEPGAAATAWSALRGWVFEQSQLLAPLREARRQAGRVRECHGDLHPANLLKIGDEVTAFDAIEFDDELRWIDVLHDISFVAMDLIAHGRPGLASRFVNAYLESSGDYDGIAMLRWSMVERALVRAQVMSLVEREGARPAQRCVASDYLRLAKALSRGGDPRLAITNGLPGSGKTFVSQRLLESVGAIRVRSDVERKRLFGLDALQSSRAAVPEGIYDADATTRTYARLLEVARVTLAAGWPVLVDAAFLRRAERARFAALADARAVPFTIVDCQAEPALLRRRLAQRAAAGNDASEADGSVLDFLTERAEPLDAQEREHAIVANDAPSARGAMLAERWLSAGGAVRPAPGRPGRTRRTGARAR